MVAYATGRASHDRQVKGNDPDKKGYPGPPGWGLGLRLTNPHRKNQLVPKPNNQPQKGGKPLLTKEARKDDAADLVVVSGLHSFTPHDYWLVPV